MYILIAIKIIMKYDMEDKLQEMSFPYLEYGGILIVGMVHPTKSPAYRAQYALWLVVLDILP